MCLEWWWSLPLLSLGQNIWSHLHKVKEARAWLRVVSLENLPLNLASPAPGLLVKAYLVLFPEAGQAFKHEAQRVGLGV